MWQIAKHEHTAWELVRNFFKGALRAKESLLVLAKACSGMRAKISLAEALGEPDIGFLIPHIFWGCPLESIIYYPMISVGTVSGFKNA